MDEAKVKALMAKWPCIDAGEGAIITCPARLAWINLDRPAGSMSKAEDLRYRATLLFPLGADLTLLRNALNAAAVDKWCAKVREVATMGHFKRGLLLQDGKEDKYDGYTKGAMRANITTKRKPKVIGLDHTELDASDPAAVYPGMWARAKVTVRAYDQNGGVGVILDMVSLQKVADDDPFGGAVDALTGYGDPVVSQQAAAANSAAPSNTKSAASIF